MSPFALAVLYNSANSVAQIRFNRPERLNALDVATADAFAVAVNKALLDPDVTVIVVSAEGRSFVAGGDLAFLRDASDRAAAAHELIAPVHGALRQLAESPKISIGSARGAVAGAGMSIILNLDLVVASDNATFNMAYSRIGASPDCGGTWGLSRHVGQRKALELALLSETLDAVSAERLGLVNRVVAEADLETETMRLAERLARGPTIAQGTIKSLLQAASERSFAEQLDAEARCFAACAITNDFGEALDAFFAKRKPVFSGR